MSDDRKLEPPLKLDMGFGEALERFALVKPKEVAESVDRSKTKKSPEDATPRRPGRNASNSVITDRKRKPEAT